MNLIRIGLCGLGTVGGGTFNVLKRNAEQISARAGRPVVVTVVAAHVPNPQCDLGSTRFVADAFAVAEDPEVDVVAWLIAAVERASALGLFASNARTPRCT